MANYATLKAAVQSVVKTNGNQEITGANMQTTLLSIINSLGAAYQFVGVATPSTNAGTPDYNVAYVGGAGTYANFGSSVTVPAGSICIFKYNGSWTKEQIAVCDGYVSVSQNTITIGGNSYEVATDKVEIKAGTNLFNPEWLVPDFVLFATGQIIANNQYSYTQGYIKVEPNTTYSLSGASTPNGTPHALANVNTAGICFYNSSLEYISGVGTNNTSFTTPANCEYVRISVYKLYATTYPYIMMNIGSSRATWSDFNPISGYISPDATPTKNSTNLVQSGGVFDSIEKKNQAYVCDLMGNVKSTLNGMTYEFNESTRVFTLHQVGTLSQCITTPFYFSPSAPYKLRLVAKCATGTQKVCLGAFSSNTADPSMAIVELTTTEKEFVVAVTPSQKNEINIGVLSQFVNAGNDITIRAFQYIPYDESIDKRVGDLEEQIGVVGNVPISFNLAGFLQGVSRNSKYLTKIAFEGDSLTANPIGGSIPSGTDEGSTKRPIRMEYNNVPRRMYDFLSWNKPIWRRLDNTDWTKSGFSEFTSAQINQIFEGSQDKYWTSSVQGSYVEITVPSGKEHFAIVCRTKSGNGKLNVTINGSNPSTITYENPVLSGNTSYGKVQLENFLQNNTNVNTSICPINLPCGVNQIDLNVGGTPGNPYAIFQFNNLPSGQDNVIRFTTVDTNPVDIWGGFYWSGNTMVIMNIAHGGHTSSDLISQHLTDELYNGGYDAVVFEFPEMNNTRLSIAQNKADLATIISALQTADLDVCFTSCNIMGLSIPADTNYWNYSGIVSNQKDINDAIKKELKKAALPFVDLFQYFRWLTERKCGTLAGGEAGLFFTNDGQHGNILGVEIWANCLKEAFYGKAIMES